ncbi:LPXTG cell wall anchor domain-containing protein [Brevibacterium sp. S22]|uniref:LPXTG cell wall anchor domain-containing protein n=1 Tax=Brevibacterium sp. S22 TaxID=2483794 RepID=UPI0010923281|nr:LPXTG cell wall anchor domain-containing protein [Brevibacterium sp. S22]TGD31657.1 LPXTG cell wall anchor domain-containing protein [Brevibacterium sp. S22]
MCAHEDQESSSESESDSSVPDESDPQATLAQAQVTRADIADDKKGIGFSGTGFTADEKATVTVVGTDGTEYSPDKKLTVDEDGKVSGTYFFTVTDGAQVPVGKYSLYLTDLKSEKKSSKVSFEVVSKASDVDDSGDGDDKCDSATGPIKTPDETPDESETPEPSESETEDPTTEAPEPSETETKDPTTEAPEPSETKTEDPTTKAPKPSPSETDEADDKADEAPADDVKPGPAKAPDEDPTTEAPKPTETESSESEAPKVEETDEADDAEDSDDAGQTDKNQPAEDGAEGDEKAEDKAPESTGPVSPGTEDKKPAAAAQASMFIDPTEVSSEDFLGDGIKIGVSGAQPGEKVSITVEHAQGKVDRYTMSKEADSEGKVTFGVQAKVKAVLGTYNVRAQAESFDEPQGGSFTVLTNGTAVDEGGNGNGSGQDESGSDLPRTGAEMTGLALGVGLLAVGAAAVIITRRRMNASDDPAEF